MVAGRQTGRQTEREDWTRASRDVLREDEVRSWEAAADAQQRTLRDGGDGVSEAIAEVELGRVAPFAEASPRLERHGRVGLREGQHVRAAGLRSGSFSA